MTRKIYLISAALSGITVFYSLLALIAFFTSDELVSSNLLAILAYLVVSSLFVYSEVKKIKEHHNEGLFILGSYINTFMFLTALVYFISNARSEDTLLHLGFVFSGTATAIYMLVSGQLLGLLTNAYSFYSQGKSK